MGVQYKITRAEVDSLATQWCQAKHIVVMLDDVAKNFAMDVANKVLQSFIQDIADRAAAKKAAAKGEPAPAAAAEQKLPAGLVSVGGGPPVKTNSLKKSSIVLTD